MQPQRLLTDSFNCTPSRHNRPSNQKMHGLPGSENAVQNDWTKKKMRPKCGTRLVHGASPTNNFWLRQCNENAQTSRILWFQWRLFVDNFRSQGRFVEVPKAKNNVRRINWCQVSRIVRADEGENWKKSQNWGEGPRCAILPQWSETESNSGGTCEIFLQSDRTWQ